MRRKSTKTNGRIWCSILLLALPLLLSARVNIVSGAGYYVSIDGNDSNPGTVDEPWRTINCASSIMNPGDTCIVLAGTYEEGSLDLSASGTANEPIVYKADGNVVVNGSFKISGDYVHVIGFEVVGGAIGADGDYCQVLDNYVHDRTGSVGIGAYGRYGIIRGNAVVRAVQCGIMVRGEYNLIEDNDISHTLTRPPDGSFSTDADGIRFFGKGHIFRGNYVHHIMHSEAGGDPHVDCFQTWGPATDILFEQNLYLSVDTYGSNQIFMSEELEGEVSGLTFRNNIFVVNDPGYCPMNFDAKISGQHIENIAVVNNTFVHPNGKGQGIAWLHNVKNAVIKNNIVYDFGDGNHGYVKLIDDCQDIDIGSNCVYNSDGVPPTGEPYPGDLWMLNPNFVDFENEDFRLRLNSPCIDRGEILPEVRNDYIGTPRPQGRKYDIGAYERKSY